METKTRPRLLDLYSGAGGAARGYQRAGFHVTGVDHAAQPRYAGDEFHRGDALAFLVEHGHEFDAIHASPPCQSHTALRYAPNAKRHTDLVAATRILLIAAGRPYVIENVVGAPLNDPVTMCGTMFDLGTPKAELRRHRLFESNVALHAPASSCRHGTKPRVIGVYGSHARNRNRGAGEPPNWSVAEAGQALGIDWMTLTEMSQALPPAYTEHVGRILIRAFAEGAQP